MEQVDGLDDTVETGTRSVDCLGQCRAGADEDGVVAVGKDAVDGHVVAAHHAARTELHAERLNLLYLISYDLFRQTIFGDTVHKHAAGLVLSLKDGDAESLTGKVAGNGQSGGTGTNHSHTAARLLRKFLAGEVHLSVEVGKETLQTADLYRLAFLSEHAITLTLFLVRAYAAADGGQIADFVYHVHGFTEVALRQLMDEVGNIVAYGTALAALRHLAVQTALGLGDGFKRRERLMDYLKRRLLFFLHISFVSGLRKRKVFRGGRSVE